MAKKSKEKKFSFNFLKDYLEKRIVEIGLSDYVTSAIIEKDEDEALRVTFDANGYKCQIDCDYLSITINYEYNFYYDSSEVGFDIIDVFNVLDIKDFSDCSFMSDADDKEEQKKVIDALLGKIMKYDYDIRKAGTDDYIAKMEVMHNADKIVADSDDLKLREIIRCARLESKMKRTKKDKHKEAYIKALKSREEKNLLTTYDKRYIAYLEQGYPIPEEENTDNEDYLGYVKLLFIALVICIFIGMGICLGVTFIDKAVVDNKGFYVYDGIVYFIAAIAGGLLSYLLFRLFATKIVVSLAPEGKKEYVKNERKKRYDDYNLIQKIWSRYISTCIAFIGAPLMLLVACTGVCFTENTIIDHTVFMDNEIKYEDAKISLVKSWFDEDAEEYIKYDYPCYRIEYGEESSVETGEIKNKDVLKEIERIFSEHNITPVEVEE